MNPIDDPYTPNAGRRPPVLAGRDREEAQFALLLDRLNIGNSEQSLMVIGLRGVGKTVLLGRFAEIAEQRRWVAIDRELTGRVDLGPLMAKLARSALLRLSTAERWKDRARQAAGVLRNFSVTVTPDGSITIGGEGIPDAAGYGDSGSLDSDLTDLLVALGEAAREQDRGVAFLFDEVQNIGKADLEALVVAYHKTIQLGLPIVIVLAGLPLLPALVGDAKSYAERIFQRPFVGALPQNEAVKALVEPAARLGVGYDDAAVARAMEYTEGYPYFIQEIGSIVWRHAVGPQITLEDVEEAIGPLEEKLDESFFAIRTAKTTDLERDYLRAMAELPRGPKSSGDIATMLGYSGSEKVGATRANLISRGLIYTPSTGYADFTVPQFDLYMKRTYALVRRTPGGRKRGRSAGPVGGLRSAPARAPRDQRRR